MARNTVVVSITSNIKGLQKGLGDAESGLSKFGKVAGAAVLAAGAVATALGVKAVKSASQLEQAMGGLEAVFKDNFGVMEQYASKAASSVGLAKSEYASLATVLGAQLKNMGVATDQLAGQTDSLVRLGADLAAQFGGSTADAVSSLSALLRGERDPIEKYGVSIKAADIAARLAEKGLKGLTGEAAKQAETMVLMELLYEQTADAQGAFARESTTLAGAQQRLGAGLENLSATFGTALLPAVTAVTSALGALVAWASESDWFAALTERVTNASNAFADFVFGVLNGTTSLSSLDLGAIFQSLLDGAVDGITAAADWLASGGAATLVNGLVSGRVALFDAAFKVFPAILEALIAAIPAIVQGLVSLVTQLAAMLVTQAPIILNGALQLFTSLLTALVTILPSLIQAIVALLPVIVETVLGMIPALLDTAVQLFTALVEALPIILPVLIAAIVDLLPKLVATILNLIPAILDAAVELFTALVDSLPIILPLLLRAILDLLPRIVSTVISMIPRLLNAAIDLFIALVEAIPRIIPDLVRALIDLAPRMISTILSMVPKLLQAGIDLIGGLVSGLWRAAGSVGQALLDIAGGAIKGFLSFFGINSPSRLMAGFGKNIDEGLAKGIRGNLRTVGRAVEQLNDRVTSTFSPMLSAPELAFATSSAPGYAGFGASPLGNTYNITVQAVSPNAEVGRAVVEAIRDYENAGGRQ